MYLIRIDMTGAQLARQRAEAEIAVRLAPKSPEAHEALGGALNVGPNTDPYAADKEFQIALRYAPNDARLTKHTLSFYRQTGQWEEYEKAFLRLVQLDPRNADFLGDYGAGTHFKMGRFADAIHWGDLAANISGDTLGNAIARAWVYVHWKGTMDSVHAWMRGEGGQRARREH
jgi:Tfp pilus assembly protein PilF